MGYFGYVAFCDDDVSGDILMNFRPTIFSESIKMGFVLSVALSFPLIIYPCRASIYTLFFGKVRHIRIWICGPNRYHLHTVELLLYLQYDAIQIVSTTPVPSDGGPIFYFGQAGHAHPLPGIAAHKSGMLLHPQQM